ncbi:alpha/beta hydrolase [Sandaracinobacter neustonicus]|uniref:Alpha/beta hydrolase n=1 Tax=Sandaracinobacter neustonicus TaxID=1715348 RepID=A0A501XRG0_9SPHN|nr:alpha/beta hydrolase [Sandaracinobacter neustonicus]TPE62697.1 alpha/beta hydrolase [Sandaracinobacter neustonicus]
MQNGPASHSYISQRLKLHYADWGNPDASPLLLLHGGRDHCRNWDWTAEALRHKWHILTPDWRGHGDSQWSADGEYKMLPYIYDLAQLIHQQGLAPVTIVAHSMGGNIALRYSGLFPEHVRKIVVIEGLGMSPTMQEERNRIDFAERTREWIDKKRAAAGRTPRRYPTLEAALARMMEENKHLSEAQARHLTIHGVNRNEDGSFSWKFDPYLNIWGDSDMTQEQVETLWSRITAPALLLYGANSWASNPAVDGRIRHFQNAEVKLYENAGHWLHHDQFERFIGDLERFL